MKTCPRCTGPNHNNARICEYCGKPFAPPAPRKKQDWGAILLVVVVVGLCLGFAFLFNKNDDEPSVTTSQSAWYACRQFVEERLKAPKTADFETYKEYKVTHIDYDEWKVTMTVDAENSFGAMIRSEFECQVRDEGDNWRLISIDEN